MILNRIISITKTGENNPVAIGFTNLRLTVISHSMEKLLCEKLMPFKPSKTVPGLHEKTHYYLDNLLW